MTDKVQKIREEVEKLMYGFNLEADIASCEDSETEKLANIKYQLCKKILEYIDSLQEEPVSDGRDIFDNCLKSEEKFILPQKISGNINCENCLYSSACALGDIQACIIDKPVSEDLEEAVNEYAPDFSNDIASKAAVDAVRDAFKAGASWQFERAKEALLSEVLPCFMHGGEADEVVAMLDEVLNFKKK